MRPGRPALSSIEIEDAFFTRETAKDIRTAFAAELPGVALDVDADQFDGSIDVRHQEPLPDDLAARVARRLRGGRDVDLSAPTDWHVTAVLPLRGWVGSVETIVGTTFCFSRTFRIPAGYDEDARSWA